MITFYPGPSKVYPQVAEYAAEAVRTGIVSLNHRSAGFMAIVEETVRLLHEKLDIPADYHIALVSSATECWEIVAQSLTANASLHPYSPDGAFGKKWAEYAYRIKPPTSLNEADVLCIVQNETSNGTQVSMDTLAQFRRDFSSTHCRRCRFVDGGYSLRLDPGRCLVCVGAEVFWLAGGSGRADLFTSRPETSRRNWGACAL